MFGTTTNGSSIQIDCKKRLFDEDNLCEKDEEIQERSSIKKQKIISTRYHCQIPNQPFVVLTSHQNERYYLLVRDDDDDCFKFSLNNGSKASLLKVSVDEMIEKRVREELEELTKSIDDQSAVIMENEDESALSIIDEYTDELWVEKFAPRAFCDLLSDIEDDDIPGINTQRNVNGTSPTVIITSPKETDPVLGSSDQHTAIPMPPSYESIPVTNQ